MAAGPSVLLLDEPFSSLDLTTRLTLASRLGALDVTLVMASHDVDLFAGFDRVIWLKGGEVAADGAPDEIVPLYEADARARAEIAVARSSRRALP
ncbi:hypothetical protein [Xanthobacter autotrophicus]|uniref:hypothetical protein n=1 Tax=Xanthobacter autotrophicus TaxID=280 RepID=UPI003AB9A431